MTMRQLSPLQRAYFIGLRRGYNRALAKMRCKAEQWETEICELQDEYQILLDEMRIARDERAVREAADERALIPDTWLN